MEQLQNKRVSHDLNKNQVDIFRELGNFVITKEQREQYKAGALWKKWLKQYPELFDEKDKQFFRNQAVFGYGFVETIAIIYLYNSTGYISMFGSYGLKTQQPKNEIVQEIVSEKTWKTILNMSTYHSQPPDLLVYAPDRSDYFFCEVKGPGDRLRQTQINYFHILEQVSVKPVYILKFKYAPINKF